ncbi:MAG: ATP-binding protein [Candidatus Limivivens sp.]|nr:ATP-binding protein [Candidatus Limivivens sp.]
MKRRIYINILILAALTISLVSFICMLFFHYVLKDQVGNELAAEAAYVAQACEEADDAVSFCASVGHTTQTRVTLIDPLGEVLYDSEADTGEMENHLDRPEVQQALKSGEGTGSRLSKTMRTVTFYHAVRLSDGKILRLSAEHASNFQIFLKMLPLLLIVALLIMFCALLGARHLTGGIVTTINAIDLKEPAKSSVFPELSPLLERMDRQNRQIEQQMADLLEQERKFNTITRNMNEGLILLDGQERIIFINQSLKTTLGAENMDYTGKNISLFQRSREMSDVIAAAKQGKAKDTLLTFYERKIHLYGNPVLEEGRINGVVLFLVDISEKEKAEQMRREFTANVSHELKTPLTSISGYAEMIQNQMVRPEDIPVFAGKIYEEAGRLLVLINDIIKLSRMDEGQAVQAKEVLDLKDIGTEVQTRLLPVAGRRQVEFQADLQSIQFLGVRSMLYDMMFNLCENAIKYNKDHGTVFLEIFEKGERPVIRVTDTGIGIPAEHQERIFERFYRVDKSHSRQTGGTGLGLSIVKHVVEYHGGYIEIHSREGVGTVITVHL